MKWSEPNSIDRVKNSRAVGSDDCDSSFLSTKQSRRTESEGKDSQRVQRYFTSVHPGRGNQCSRLIFNRGSDQRVDALRDWAPFWDQLRVLDIGCGDGTLLAQAIHGTPKLIRLEDLVQERVNKASSNLSHLETVIEGVARDSSRSNETEVYDVVLAIGVFDYNNNWPNLLQITLRRCSGVLIVDFPKSGTLHAWLRHLWLGVNGIKLHTIDKDGLLRMLDEYCADYEIKENKYNWLVRIVCNVEK